MHMNRLTFLALVGALAACGTTPEEEDDTSDPPKTPKPDPRTPAEIAASDAARVVFFETTTIHKVEVKLPAADWDRYMKEHRNLDPDFNPTWFTAEVVVDGTSVPNTGIKNFGYGSREVSPNKPNIRVDFSKNVRTQFYKGIDEIRLKNNGQDTTGLRQPIVFESLRAAGLMASRTSYAEVVVNGEPFGFYLVEEPFGREMVRIGAGNNDGTAYEASDCQGFVAPPKGCGDLLEFYDRPFNDELGEGEDLKAICEVMNGPADRFVSGVSQLVKLDEWTLGVAADLALAGDYDGFSTSGANFRLYNDTKLKRMRLVIGGPDTTFDALYTPDPLKPRPSSNCRNVNPHYRDIFLEKLTGTPAGLEQYKAAVRQLRTGVMAPAKLRARVDALWAITGAKVKEDKKRPPTPEPEAFKELMKTFFDQRDAELAKLGM